MQLRRASRQPGSPTTLVTMESRKRSSEEPSESWKSKMGVEFSGLERPRDFLVALAVLAVFVLIAMAIAFVAFG